MPTYYKHINGKKIGGLPEVVRVDDCFEQLLSNNFTNEPFKNTNIDYQTKNGYKFKHFCSKKEVSPMNYNDEYNKLSPMVLDNRRISGFRFDLNKNMIGKSPHYSCYGELCNRVEYKSDMFYPFLMNNDLL